MFLHVSFVDHQFDVVVPAVEIVPQNFNSVAGILAMVVRLRESGF